MYPNGTSNYITKNGFDGVQVILFVGKFLKELWIIVVLISRSWTSSTSSQFLCSQLLLDNHNLAKSRCKLSSQVQFASNSFSRYSCFKVNKSLYIAKSRQRHDRTLNNFLLHLPNHAFEDLYVLNNGTNKRINKQTFRIIVRSRCW